MVNPVALLLRQTWASQSYIRWMNGA